MTLAEIHVSVKTTSEPGIISGGNSRAIRTFLMAKQLQKKEPGSGYFRITDYAAGQANSH